QVNSAGSGVAGGRSPCPAPYNVRMKTRWAIAAAVTAAGAIAACSGSTTGASGGPYDSCLGSLLGSECVACLNSNCGGAVGDMESGCGDYLGCICPGGNFSAPNAESQTCASKLQESSCVSTQGDGGATACVACQSACSAGTGSSSGGGQGSSSGSTNGGSSGSSSGASGGSSSGSTGGCGNGVLPGTSAVTLSLTGVDFGSATASAWKDIGFDLDGKCTTASSTDTCDLQPGASKSAQVDGASGIDNSYGENLCPIFEAAAGPGACAIQSGQVYLQTDASGSGSLVTGSASTATVIPVRDVHIAMSGSGGMAGGVMPTAGLVAAWQKEAACISTSLCSGAALQSILTQLEQASDIGADGSNTPGAACDGISFGLTFTGSTPVSAVPTQATCPCP
ncbi:MAG: hypothetical protein ACRELB_26600, partial [Polyangiaceae bacterium]